MLQNLKKSDQKGFTIIEVMIVLAIAGIILLIVLLAIPALQRNSRNTQIKNDASALAGAISTYASDNDGKVPKGTNAVTGTGTVTLTDGGTPTPITATVKIQGSTEVTTVNTVPTTAASVGSGKIQVYPGKSCGGADSARAFAIYYVTESSGSLTLRCLEA